MSITALVTGADGFIGSHLVEHLVSKGIKVRAFCMYNSFNSWGWLDTLPKAILDEVEIVLGDIRDVNNVRQAVKGCDHIYHLAALIAIPFSYTAPDSYIATNINGTLNILQAGRDMGVSHIMVTSTSEVYGTAVYVPIDENHPRQGQSPYSASKIGADALAESFYRSFNTPVTIVRPFNTYGPRQSARAIIPTVISQLLAGQKTINLGALEPTRDLLYVKDTVNGFFHIAGNELTLGASINIATGVEISIGDLANTLIQLINPEATLAHEQNRMRPENSEVFRLLGNASQLRKLTGWEPEYTLEQGLAATIDWFKTNGSAYTSKAGIYTV